MERGITPSSGYRLPDATWLGQVHLQVADVQRSLAYYQGVLGLGVIRQSAGHVVLGVGGDDTPLVELHERVGATPVPRRGRLGLYHYAILLPDRAALGRFIRHLAETGVRAGASDHLVSEALYLQDPDGLGIEVYADRPRSTWRYDGRQLMMDTRPLDMEDLVRAAGDERWAGMPTGTTLGHVHLHVGDLDQAAAFFHEGLGFNKVVWSYPGALFLSAGGYHHHLGVNTWAAGAAPAQEGDARLLEWTVVVPGEVDAAAESIRSAGFPVTQDGDGWFATDPWGTTLRLLSGS